MRLPILLLLASLVSLCASSCKRSGDDSTSGPASDRRTRRPASMPKPLRLPDRPAAALHTRDIGQHLWPVVDASPAFDNSRDLVIRTVRGSRPGFEGKLVDFLDVHRPLDIAVVEGQTIVHAYVTDPARVETLLANFPKEGKFGAVVIQRGPEDGTKQGPKLAYLDKQAKSITLADDLRGIATGTELARKYGRQPLFVTVTREEARKWGVELPATTIEIRGQGSHDFELVAEGVADRPEFREFSDGALTGLLEFKEIAVGASSKYTDYQRVVNDIISNADRQVKAQNFLVRGNLEDLLGRAKAVLRSWNGRVMLGAGPANHALIGLGTQDPGKTENATLHLINGVLGNLKMAKSFGLGGLPKIRFARNWGTAAGTTIHALALERAQSTVPAQYRSLLNEKGELKIAMAFPQRAGAAVVVIGADSPRVLTRWLEANANATPGRESLGHTGAVTVAVSPFTLSGLAQSLDPAAALRLSATAPPTRVVIERRNDRFKVNVKGPVIKLSPAGRQAAASQRPARRRTTPARAGRPARRTAPPGTGKPAGR